VGVGKCGGVGECGCACVFVHIETMPFVRHVRIQRYSKESARPFLEKTRPFRETAQPVFFRRKIGWSRLNPFSDNENGVKPAQPDFLY